MLRIRIGEELKQSVAEGFEIWLGSGGGLRGSHVSLRETHLLSEGGFEILGTDDRFVSAVAESILTFDDSLSRIPLGGQHMVLARKPHA